MFIEKQGFLQQVPGVSIGEKSLMIAVKNIARRLGDDISESKPILDSRLPDGNLSACVVAAVVDSRKSRLSFGTSASLPPYLVDEARMPRSVRDGPIRCQNVCTPGVYLSEMVRFRLPKGRGDTLGQFQRCGPMAQEENRWPPALCCDAEDCLKLS